MSDLNRSIKLFIDGSEATNNVEKVKESIARLEQKLSSLNASEKDYASKSKQLKSELDAKNRALQNYEKQIEATNRVLHNLSGASYDELLAVSSKVRKELRAAVPGTQQYTAALEQNRRVTEALSRAQTAMRVEVGCQGSIWGRASNFVNKYIGLAGAAVAAITGVSMKLNQLRETRNKREEGKADVEALTGLDKESINWLEQQAIQLSTKMTESGIRIRQSATEILDAYKLVGSAKPELLNDKEALEEVTEQTLILAQASGMSLKDAVDAVTLSLNQYGDGADQAARYSNVMAAGSKYGSAAVESVTSAITKSGVAAASAHIPIEQLVGTIETLAEKGIKDEIAGTGLKKFFLTLQTGADETNPAIVGLDTALDNLQKKQLSAAQIKKMFGEEGYNVASVLINDADKVRYYTEAVTGTSVAMEQAATKSDTAAAKLDQAKNKMGEMGIQLMEKLNPGIVSVVNRTVSWTGKLITLIGFITEHSRTIGMLCGIIGGYIVISKAQIIEEKLKFFWQEKVVASMKRGYEVMLRHPYAAVAAAVLVLIAYYRDMNKELTSSERIEKSLSDIRKQATNDVRLERAEVEQMLDVARNERLSKGEREAAIRRLNEISPEYLGNLTLDKINTDEATAAVNSYVESLIILEDIKRTQSKIGELQDTKDDMIKDGTNFTQMDNIRSNLAHGLNSIKSIFVEYTGIGSSYTDAWADNTIRDIQNKGLDAIRSVDDEIEALNNHLEDSRKKLIKVEGEKPKFTPSTTSTGEDPDKEKAKKALQKKLKEEDQIYSDQQAKLKEAYLAGNNDRLKTEKQFNEELECLKLEHLQRIINIASEESKEGTDAQNQINDVEIKRRQAMLQQQIADEKKLYEDQQTDLKSLYVSGKDENLKTEKSYNEAMEQLTIMHLQRVLQIANLDADQRRDIEKQLLDFKVKCLQDDEAERKKHQDKEQQKKDALAKREKQRLQEQAQQYRQYGEQIGDSIGQMLTNQENALQGFADTMIDILFDVLSQMIEIEIAKATGVAVGAVSRASAESFAQPDSVATFGASGAARAAILSGLIMGALAAAKSALKGLVGKGGGSSGSGDSNQQKTAQVVVKQWASGRYDVIGQNDGKTYRDIPYIGNAPTGIVRRTSLVSENGAELIVNAEDLSRLQHHVNYPLVVQAIQDARIGRVPQRANGNYSPMDTSLPDNNINPWGVEISSKEAGTIIQELKGLIAVLKNLKAYVVLRDLHEAEELDAKSKYPFTRKTK